MARSGDFWNWFDTEARPRLTGRADTFVKMFEYLDQFDRPVGIIETGCVRKADNWEGDGQSTVLFDRYVHYRGGTLYSVDIDPRATKVARKLTQHALIHTGDSVAFLKSLSRKDAGPLDLLYLDSFDLVVSQPIPAALHHMNELTAILPLVRADTLVVVDDSPGVYEDHPFPHVDVGGKGMFVALHAKHVGADMVFHIYQAGWTHMHGASGPTAEDDGIAPLVERARVHVEAGNNVAAETLYRIVLGRTTPPTNGIARVAHGEACLFYARLAVSKHKYGTAADWYREALNADPRAVDYRMELCVKAYNPMANTKIAQQEAIKATLIEPDNPLAWHVLGGIEHELGNIKNCIACYDTQLELSPDDPHAMLDRVTIALDVADYELSRELCAKVMKTDRAPDATHVMAMIAYREGRHEEAIELYQKAIDGGCRDKATAHWNMSLALHAIGRYREGWVAHEWRKHERNNAALSLPMWRFTRPMWTGAEPPPARIHTHAEAGMGDNIAMARYLPLLAERGYDVRYETHDDMIALMTRSLPGVKVVRKAPDYPGAIGIEPFDYHLPVGSLPAVFETDIDTVPWFGPYLKADPALVAEYKRKLQPWKGRKIGLVWSSGIREGVWISTYGKMKSMKLATMMPLVEAFPEHTFVSLQVGPERAELDEFRDVLDILPERPTWDDTAALVECLDVIVTVDTGTSHLVGAMGKPVMLAMHRNGSWHYMCERPGAPWNERSPWYPNTVVYRQAQDWEWGDVIEKIGADIRAEKWDVMSTEMKSRRVA